MHFKSYCEIENTYNNKIITQAREMGFDNPDIKYICATKLDGCNFQVSIDENEDIQFGSRSQLLGRETDFHGYFRAMRNEDVENKLRQMKKFILESLNGEDHYDSVIKNILSGKFILTVYGELLGGMYRHKEVEKVKGSVKIQGRIDYHPDNMWVPFDIVLRSADENYVYMCTTNQVKTLCDQVGLPSQIIKFEGTLDECLKYPNDFIDDTGNILWNLPLIEDNITEGVVIKPVKPMWFNNGQRVIFKNKNDKFKERTCHAPKEPKEIIPMNDLEKKYYEFAREFITENRLMSVFSKIDTVTEKGFGMILGMFLKDLWKDFDKDYFDEIAKLEKEFAVDEFNFAKVRKEISKEVTEFIRPEFVKILNS